MCGLVRVIALHEAGTAAAIEAPYAGTTRIRSEGSFSASPHGSPKTTAKTAHSDWFMRRGTPASCRVLNHEAPANASRGGRDESSATARLVRWAVATHLDNEVSC